MEQLWIHAQTVNGCSAKVWKRHVDDAETTHFLRSQRQWTIDLGNYASLMRGS
jgi:hypothetical protein